MGREYRVILDETDHQAIIDSVARDEPKSLDELLKRLPGYIPGSQYEYSYRPEGMNCFITRNGFDLDILVYRLASEEPLIQSLYSDLIHLCGRFRIEES